MAALAGQYIAVRANCPKTTSCERSFSVMKLIKTYLRNRTEDDRLSDLATLFVHKERVRALDRGRIIDTFASRVDRRVQFN